MVRVSSEGVEGKARRAASGGGLQRADQTARRETPTAPGEAADTCGSPPKVWVWVGLGAEGQDLLQDICSATPGAGGPGTSGGSPAGHGPCRPGCAGPARSLWKVPARH